MELDATSFSGKFGGAACYVPKKQDEFNVIILVN